MEPKRDRQPEPPARRSRRTAWLRDELILALDLYQREGRNASVAGVAEVSDLLRRIPIEPELAESTSFRNPASVALKVSNFVAIDPGSTTRGMSRGGRGDREVFAEFWPDPSRLAAAAAAIRANVAAAGAREADAMDDDFADAPEGRVLTRVHRVRERNAKLVRARKAQVLADGNGLACQGCGFDFASFYGLRGQDFIECHHTIPVSELKPGSRTKLSDLALVCSNCHRMIHRRAPWLTLDQLRVVVANHAARPES